MMMKYLVRTLLLLGLVTFPVQAATEGSVHGTVIDAALHQPITGAVIRIAGPSFAKTAHSDRSGHFVFLGLTPDLYTMTIFARDHRSVALQVCVRAGDAQSLPMLLGTQESYAKEDQRVAVRAASLQQTGDTYTVGSCQGASVP
jgi:hypothetical protein